MSQNTELAFHVYINLTTFTLCKYFYPTWLHQKPFQKVMLVSQTRFAKSVKCRTSMEKVKC